MSSKLTIADVMRAYLASGGLFAISAVRLECSGSAWWVVVNDAPGTAIKLFANRRAAERAVSAAVDRVVR